MSKWKKFFKGLGVASVPALCTYAIIGAVVVPLLIFETGASKEYNNTAHERSKKFWATNFSSDNGATDTLDKHFKFAEHEDQFMVDGRKSSVFELTDADGKVINQNSDKLMIFTHGLNSTHWNVMESAFYWSLMGYRVISWDQRGGGQNRASHITFGYAEAEDLNSLYTAVVNNKDNNYSGINKVTIYGQSNGAATTISFADRFQKQVTDAEKNHGIKTSFIEESGYTSPKRQFNTALNLHGIMPDAIVPLTIPMYELYADKNLSDENADYLAQSDQIQQPLFIAHGDEDPIVDYQMGVELYKKMMADSDNKIKPSIQIGKGLGHIGLSRDSDLNNVDNNIVQDVTDLFTSLLSASGKNSAIKLWTDFDAARHKIADPKSLVAYPVAVRFFYNVFMWEEYGIKTEVGVS